METRRETVISLHRISRVAVRVKPDFSPLSRQLCAHVRQISGAFSDLGVSIASRELALAWHPAAEVAHISA